MGSKGKIAIYVGFSLESAMKIAKADIFQDKSGENDATLHGSFINDPDVGLLSALPSKIRLEVVYKVRYFLSLFLS